MGVVLRIGCIAIFKDWDCATGECRLGSGDTLVLYTDGITEAFNPSGEEFGEQRLVEALRKHRGACAAELLNAIVGDVQQFCPHDQYDDITLIVAKSRAELEQQMWLGSDR